jgi:hypothetical protein
VQLLTITLDFERIKMGRFTKVLAMVVLLCAAMGSFVQGGVIMEDYKPRVIFGLQTTGIYDPVRSYKIGSVDWIDELHPPTPVDILYDSTNNPFPALHGWSFVAATNHLSDNSLKIHSYDVRNTSFVGILSFDVEYVPGMNDPTNDIHWIQVITTNHKSQQQHMNGSVTYLDNVGRADPYYDSTGTADSRNFLDDPFRSDGHMIHEWIADLYLVSGPPANTPGEVKVYSGIRWGWKNHPVPEPSSLVIFVLGSVGLFSYSYCRRSQ